MTGDEMPGGLLERLVARSVHVMESSQSADGTRSAAAAARTLLADHLACVAGARMTEVGPARGAGGAFADDGTCGRAAAMAVRAHSRDLDDVYWPAGTHIGSIIWSVVLALAAENRSTGAEIERAARLGYQVAGNTATLLGSTHAAQWHVTATAGTVGSAAAAAMVLGQDFARVVAACGHAAAMAGGVGQSIAERASTVAFHRASAAATGILAARFAGTGAVAASRVLEGPRGLCALTAGESGEPPDLLDDVLPRVSVRIYPVNGFSQGAVELTARLRQRLDGTLGPSADVGLPRSITVAVARPVAAATTGEVGGDWWDLRGAVAAAWVSGDAFRLQCTAESAVLREHVRIEPEEADIGTTRVAVEIGDSVMRDTSSCPPGYRPTAPDSVELLRRKWDCLGAVDPLHASDRILAGGISVAELDSLIERPKDVQGAPV